MSAAVRSLRPSTPVRGAGGSRSSADEAPAARAPSASAEEGRTRTATTSPARSAAARVGGTAEEPAPELQVEDEDGGVEVEEGLEGDEAGENDEVEAQLSSAVPRSRWELFKRGWRRGWRRIRAGLWSHRWGVLSTFLLEVAVLVAALVAKDAGRKLTWKSWATLGVLVLDLGLLLMGLLPTEAVLLLGSLLLMVMQIITPEKALAGFANSGVATIAILFIVANGLERTGGPGLLVRYILRRGISLRAAVARLTASTALVSGFVNNTPLVAMLIPIVKSYALREGIDPRKLLMPLSFGAILGGTCTLIGTSTNLVVLGLAKKFDPSISLPMFELSMIGVPSAILGILYMIFFFDLLLPGSASAAETHATLVDDAPQEGCGASLRRRVRGWCACGGSAGSDASSSAASADASKSENGSIGTGSAAGALQDSRLRQRGSSAHRAVALRRVGQSDIQHHDSLEEEDDDEHVPGDADSALAARSVSYFFVMTVTPDSDYVGVPLRDCLFFHLAGGTELLRRVRRLQGARKPFDGVAVTYAGGETQALGNQYSDEGGAAADAVVAAPSTSMPALTGERTTDAPATNESEDAARDEESGDSSLTLVEILRESRTWRTAETDDSEAICNLTLLVGDRLVFLGTPSGLVGLLRSADGIAPVARGHAHEPGKDGPVESPAGPAKEADAVRHGPSTATLARRKRAAAAVAKRTRDSGVRILVEAAVASWSPFVGMTAREFGFQQRYNATIVAVQRGAVSLGPRIPVAADASKDSAGRSRQASDADELDVLVDRRVPHPTVDSPARRTSGGRAVGGASPSSSAPLGSGGGAGGALEGTPRARVGLDRSIAEKRGLGADSFRIDVTEDAEVSGTSAASAAGGAIIPSDRAAEADGFDRARLGSSEPGGGRSRDHHEHHHSHHAGGRPATPSSGHTLLAHRPLDTVLQPGDILLLEAPQLFVQQHKRSSVFALVSVVDDSTYTVPVPLDTTRAVIAVLAVLASLTVTAFEIVDIFICASVVAVVFLLLRIIDYQQAKAAIDFPILFSVAAAFGLGDALYNTRMADAMASLIVAVFERWGTFGIILGVYISTALLSQLVTNAATVAVMFPIALSVADEYQINIKAIIYILMMAGSDFMTPIGYQTNLMVAGVAGYKFVDFTRFGGFVQLIVCIISSVLCYFLFT